MRVDSLLFRAWRTDEDNEDNEDDNAADYWWPWVGYYLPTYLLTNSGHPKKKMSPTIFEDKAPNVAAAIIILVAISAVVFPLRIYTRVKHKAFGWDDFTMCCAAVSCTLL